MISYMSNGKPTVIISTVNSWIDKNNSRNEWIFSKTEIFMWKLN